jgi:hypothetical protein
MYVCTYTYVYTYCGIEPCCVIETILSPKNSRYCMYIGTYLKQFKWLSISPKHFLSRCLRKKETSVERFFATKDFPVKVWRRWRWRFVNPHTDILSNYFFQHKHTFFLGGGVSATPCASPPRPSIFWIILFLSTTLSTGMTGISLHMQCPMTPQSHGSFLKENNWFLRYGSNSTPTQV